MKNLKLLKWKYNLGAFTLAEVLITLGIIGIVAAMTMPSLIQSHKKKVAEIRLKYFASLMSQISKRRYADDIAGNFVGINRFEPNNPDLLEEYFNIYIKPYSKWVKTKKLTKGFAAALPNGSGVYYKATIQCSGSPASCTFMFFCPEYKFCEKLEEYPIDNEKHRVQTMFVDGKNSHFFWIDGTPDVNVLKNRTREQIVELAKNSAAYCTSLIYYDGWSIENDNPCWK